MSSSSSIIPCALVADDQIEVLEALRLLLKGEGIQVHAVTSPAAVLEALAARDFDILLMDLNYARDTTSGHEGLDLLDRIVAIDETLPIIVMTGWGSVELAVRTMRRGVRDFVEKPWDNERLVRTLRTHIEQGQLLRKGRRLEAEGQALREELRHVKDIHTLLRIAAQHLQSGLRAGSVVVFTKGSLDQTFWVAAQVGVPIDLAGQIKFEADSRIIQQVREACDPGTLDLPESERNKIRQMNTALIAPIRFKDEFIGFMCLSGRMSGSCFDAEDIKFVTVVVGEIGVGLDGLKLRSQEREYEEAKEIQHGLLPKEIPQIAGHEIFGAWQPASAVGGDYFDVLKFSNGVISLCIADVVGKGLPAALLMSNLQAAVKAFAAEHMKPKDLSTKVNRIISSNIASNKFITFFYCRHDSATGVIHYTNAGHNPPILLKADGPHNRLLDGGPVLGVFKDWDFDQNHVEFRPGDRIVLFTDGVTEVINAQGEEFGEERLIALLERSKKLSARRLHEVVMEAIANYGGGEFQDDATLLVMSRD